MSTIKANTVQIGQSATASQNFTLYQPTVPDGTVRLGNGNAGAATDRIAIDASGNVGIGITAPVAKLQVVGGQVLLDNAQFYAIKTSGGVSNSVLTLNGTNNLLIGAGGATVTAQIWTGGSERLRVDASGNVTPGVTNTQTLGASANVWSNVYATTFTGTNFTGCICIAAD